MIKVIVIHRTIFIVKQKVALPDSLHAYHAHIAERPAYMRAMKLNYPDLFGGE